MLEPLVFLALPLSLPLFMHLKRLLSKVLHVGMIKYRSTDFPKKVCPNFRLVVLIELVLKKKRVIDMRTYLPNNEKSTFGVQK